MTQEAKDTTFAPKFQLGQIVATPGAIAACRPQHMTRCLPQPPGPGLLHLRWEAGGVQRERLLSLSAVGLCQEGANAA